MSTGCDDQGTRAKGIEREFTTANTRVIYRLLFGQPQPIEEFYGFFFSPASTAFLNAATASILGGRWACLAV